MTDALISISAAARELGLAPSTLSRQIADGSIRCHDGKRVRLSEVVADRKANIAYPVGRGDRRSQGHDAEVSPYLDSSEASPVHYTTSGAKFNDELIRKLAFLLESEGDDDFDVGVDCIFVGMEIIEHQYKLLKSRLKDKQGISKSGPDLTSAILRIGNDS